MQTVYYQTSNFIRHTGNVVDLNEYRRKMALAQEGSLAPQPLTNPGGLPLALSCRSPGSQVKRQPLAS